MTLKEFFKKHLHDYHKKGIEFFAEELGFALSADCEASEFYDRHLDEVIQNFADKICQKQRENCGKFARSFDVIRNDIDIESAIIEHSLQPKIDEL